MNAALESLEPSLLWRHFRVFCDTPRPSGAEAALAAKIEAWAEARGFAHERDAAGNLRVRKPASPGCEGRPGIVLQGHLDMVSERAADVDHDFARDPIQTVIDGEWVRAKGTTLGADNGIGAAAALAVLDDDALTHGPLEALMTVEEEVSLVGARQLAEGWLAGRILLNLDSEEEGAVYIGCAGGTNVATDAAFEAAPVDANTHCVQLGVTGLSGGHSGLDIHRGLGNANRLLARLLARLSALEPRLVDWQGGTMDNAITREAWATVAFAGEGTAALDEAIATAQALFAAEFAEVDAGVTIAQRPATTETALSAVDSARIVDLLNALPYGVERMSSAAPGVVETSNNLGIVRLENTRFHVQAMVRSLRDDGRDALAARIGDVMRRNGFTPAADKGYPGWTPDPDSALLARFIRVHETVAGERPAVNVIHAGLECGLIGAKYPGMEMISFGPTIRGAHSPDERVHIGAVTRFYAVLRSLIEDLARAD